MILFRAAIFLTLVAVACSSSEPEQEQPAYPNMISVNPPQKQQAAPSTIYIDSVRIINYKEHKALLISGNMANGCTYLQEASHTMAGDSLKLSLKAWKPADKICSQALVPFSFIYDNLTVNQLTAHTEAVINEKAFKIERE